MQIALSGSRNGPTFPRQKVIFQQTLFALIKIAQTIEPRGEPLIFRHGDCVGWDAEGHDIAHECGFSIIIHPPTNPALRAFKTGAVLVMPERPYLRRNRDMVDTSERAIICPDGASYRIGSGSWYTWKYALAQKIDTLLILPDGSTRLTPGATPLAWVT